MIKRNNLNKSNRLLKKLKLGNYSENSFLIKYNLSDCSEAVYEQTLDDLIDIVEEFDCETFTWFSPEKGSSTIQHNTPYTQIDEKLKKKLIDRISNLDIIEVTLVTELFDSNNPEEFEYYLELSCED